jgi:aspartate racemase
LTCFNYCSIVDSLTRALVYNGDYMKKLGMIGGMSYESTKEYYEIINKIVNQKLGGNHSAELLIVSLDLQKIEDLMNNDRWAQIVQIMSIEAFKLELMGDCQGIIICTNTIHKIADYVQGAINVPLIHIGRVCAEKVNKDKIKRVGLLGTRFTMQENFISNKFSEMGIEVIVPSNEDINLVDSVIFNELCRGTIKESSAQNFLRIAEDLEDRGAQAIILACTELQMILKQENTDIPLYDTMQIHAEAAAEFILN